MPYVEGESLRDRLRRERQLPVDEALRITREAALALDYAHQEGVVHRDIKPENLLLTKDGSTLVADFGIARVLGADEHLTQTGSSMGTPAYMSPEQAGGASRWTPAPMSTRSACVLYEMLAGEPPFTGATAVAIIAKWFTEPVPSVRAARPEVPERMDQAIQRALAQLPRTGSPRRPSSSARFKERQPGSRPFRLPPPRGRPRRPAAGARRWRPSCWGSACSSPVRSSLGAVPTRA